MDFLEAERTKMERPWTEAKDAILQGADISKITTSLSHLSNEDIENTYEDEKNLLHFAITMNDTDMVKIFFEKGLFLPPHTSRSIPYIHMACAFGHCDIVRMLDQHRGLDKKILVSIKDELWMKCVGISPLPVSRCGEYFHDVVTLIDDSQPISSYEIATLYEHGAALEYLMGDVQDQEDIYLEVIKDDKPGPLLAVIYEDLLVVDEYMNYPFEAALYCQSPKCLDVILRYAAENLGYLAQCNAFHFMYALGNYKVTMDDCLAKCTRLLIDHGMNVNAVHAASSFPLYSLLLHVNRCYYLYKFQGEEEELKMLEEHFVCLKLLLEAGADPNFDEKASVTEDEFEVYCSEFQNELMMETKGVEKQYYSNAAHVLVELIQPNVSANLIDFVHRSFSLLKDHGCNMKGNRSMLGLAIKAQNEKKLENFLAFFDFNLESLDYAFEKSLYHVSPGCLEITLKYAVEHDVKFRQQNPYHFLSVCKWGSGPAHRCVRLLISYNYDVNKMVRRDTHPLYSMLWHGVGRFDASSYFHDMDVRRHISETCICLEEMLSAGAKTDFDEYSHKIQSHHVTSLESSLSHDYRCTFEHSARALTEVILNLDGEEYILEYLKRSVNILLAHGCDLSLKRGDAAQSVLHAIFESFPFGFEKYQNKNEKMRQRVEEICQLVTIFLSNGCDIQDTDKNSNMPLMVLCRSFEEKICKFLDDHYELNDEQLLDAIWLRLRPFLKLFDIMEVEETIIVVERYAERMKSLHERNYLSADVQESLTAEFQLQLKLKSLYHSCMIQVWRCCNFRMRNVDLLGLPWSVMQDLEAMLTVTGSNNVKQ